MSSGIGVTRSAGKHPVSASPPRPPNTATRVPGVGSATPGPSASTTPRDLHPEGEGRGGACPWYLPWLISRSAKFNPHAWMRRRISPLTGSGVGSFDQSGGVSKVSIWKARMIRSPRECDESRDWFDTPVWPGFPHIAEAFVFAALFLTVSTRRNRLTQGKARQNRGVKVLNFRPVLINKYARDFALSGFAFKLQPKAYQANWGCESG